MSTQCVACDPCEEVLRRNGRRRDVQRRPTTSGNAMVEPIFDYQFRIILIGDSTVGKSSLLKFFTDGRFAEVRRWPSLSLLCFSFRCHNFHWNALVSQFSPSTETCAKRPYFFILWWSFLGPFSVLCFEKMPYMNLVVVTLFTKSCAACVKFNLF